jgi:hypothetical protein
MKLLCVAAMLFAAASGTAQTSRIGTVDFFGYGGLDLRQLRELMPLREGDEVPTAFRRKSIARAFESAIGRAPVTLDLLCCHPDGRQSLFVGMPEPDAPPLSFHAAPTGSGKLPPEVLRLDRDMGPERAYATSHDMAGEDVSKGYGLSEYPPLRALQLKLRGYSSAHVRNLIGAIHACPDNEQRAVAAEALGYADESKRQIAGLVYASLDSDKEVRNNAIRALWVLALHDPRMARDVPVEPYIPLLFSSNWSDRNKTLLLFDSITASRDEKILRKLRAHALGPLREMAQWHSEGHAWSAIFILGRIAGIEERRLLEMVHARDVSEILDRTAR